MSNAVYNDMTVWSSKAKIRQVAAELAVLLQEIEARGSGADAILQVLWADVPPKDRPVDINDANLASSRAAYFASSGGSAEDVQNRLTEWLSRIDPKLVISNKIEESCHRFMGARLTIMSEGRVQEIYEGGDLRETIAEIEEGNDSGSAEDYDAADEFDTSDLVASAVESFLSACGGQAFETLMSEYPDRKNIVTIEGGQVYGPWGDGLRALVVK